MSDDRLRREYAELLKQSYLQSGFKQGFEAGYAKAKEDFERLQWIPCSERLPEDPDTKRIYASKTYQVTTDDGRTMVLRWCKTEIRGKIVMRWEWHDGRIYHGNVLAWKPLSEPYREEGDRNGHD